MVDTQLVPAARLVALEPAESPTTLVFELPEPPRLGPDGQPDRSRPPRRIEVPLGCVRGAPAAVGDVLELELRTGDPDAPEGCDGQRLVVVGPARVAWTFA